MMSVEWSVDHKKLLEPVKRWAVQGRIQDFKLGGGALQKIASSGGRREHFWGNSCEKSRFYAKKIIFFPILGGAPPPLDPPLLCILHDGIKSWYDGKHVPMILFLNVYWIILFINNRSKYIYQVLQIWKYIFF
jgi:hypothetical protein